MFATNIISYLLSTAMLPFCFGNRTVDVVSSNSTITFGSNTGIFVNSTDDAENNTAVMKVSRPSFNIVIYNLFVIYSDNIPKIF